MKMEEKLKKIGITIEDMVEAGVKMYVPYKKGESSEKIKTFLKEEIIASLSDINVCSLLSAGMMLDEKARKGEIPGLDIESYNNDSVDLLADEVLGIQIATYIGGTKALFEFERIDKRKPGILKKLPPFLDDVIGGLISGALVKVCSK